MKQERTPARLRILPGVVISTKKTTPPLPENERRARILRGAHRLTEQLRQEDGRPERIKQAQAFLDEATRLHSELCGIEAELAEPLQRHLPEAAAAAGRALLKTLPGFASLAEATAWAAANLPLTEARRADALEREKKNSLSQKRHTLKRAFWGASEQAAAIVAIHTSHLNDLGRAIDEVEAAGKFI